MSVSCVTIDISSFSLEPGEVQAEWYRLLRDVIQNILADRGVHLAADPSGGAFWSPGGDGGTITLIEGGVPLALDLALGISLLLHRRLGKGAAKASFPITMGLDHGPAIIGLDADGRPNVWGDSINYANRTSSACEHNQILATRRFVDELRRQARRERYEPVVGTFQKRLVKHGQFIEVYNIFDPAKGIGIPVAADTSIDVADFESPFIAMEKSYVSHLREVEGVRSGIWTLLLTRRLFDMGAITKADLLAWISRVSANGQAREPDSAPTDPFFSNFGEAPLQRLMLAGRFERYPAGAWICNTGDPARDCYIVARGRIAVTARDVVVAHREAGRVVGEMALVEPGGVGFRTDEPQRTTGMQAENDVTLFAIPYAAFREAAEHSSEVQQTFIRFYRERTKETVIASTPVLRNVKHKERLQLLSIGRLEGLARTSDPRSMALRTPALLSAFRGIARIDGKATAFSDVGPAAPGARALWVPPQTDASVTVEFERESSGAAEFLVLDGEAWAGWLRQRGHDPDRLDARALGWDSR